MMSVLCGVHDQHKISITESSLSTRNSRQDRPQAGSRNNRNMERHWFVCTDWSDVTVYCSAPRLHISGRATEEHHRGRHVASRHGRKV